ncbi:putative polyketide synthase [Gregarina niphandrodes]|uniref:Polyketide synthase n=1 Tax=Gregarina niphandrodes TaxID=110365 RepID=A0A023AZU7_GRENI|nr:putative polyketide synthase [Gregarina niphandrodes]EZG44526.1 putative polyketide synthase [Gregarina niphandrodes]|eukprot:XP_011134167.1 putative polyketide synthase [Gregarina niphandrodes]
MSNRDGVSTPPAEWMFGTELSAPRVSPLAQVPRREYSLELKALFRRYRNNPFASALSKWAREIPDVTQSCWINDRGEEAQRLSYAECNLRCRKIAVYLGRKKLRREDRVLLCFVPSLDFITAFFGCIISGVIAVPVYPPQPGRVDYEVPRFCDIMDKADVSVAFTHGVDKRWKKINWIDINEAYKSVSDADAYAWQAPELHVNSVVFLQFTSGSTSSPKGVVVTHGSLLHNVHAAIHAFGLHNKYETPDEEAICVDQFDYLSEMEEFWKLRHGISERVFGHRLKIFSWLPVYHDMGLIGFTCSPLFFGGILYQMSPIDFIRKPHVWLKAMSDYNCVYCGAPNFAFEVTARKMTGDKATKEALAAYRTLDLSKMSGFLSGAEPIRASTLKHFHDSFASKGFRYGMYKPCFGLAENTLIVSGVMDTASPPLVVQIDAELLRTQGTVKVLRSGRFREENGCAKCRGPVGADPCVQCVEAAVWNQDLAQVGDSQAVLTYVGCGRPCHGMDVRIVDPELLSECPSNRTGEVWVGGDSVARGYFGEPEKTREEFFAQFQQLDTQGGDPALGEGGRISAQAYLRTGDRGFLHECELFICGRIKDLIIIRGRNYFPQDLEECLESIPQLKPGNIAVFMYQDEGEDEEVAVAAELREPKAIDTTPGGTATVAATGYFGSLLDKVTGADNQRRLRETHEHVARQVQKCISQKFGLPVRKVWLLNPRCIPKTSSGKIRRNPTKEQLLDKNSKSQAGIVLEVDFKCEPTKRSAKSPAAAAAAEDAEYEYVERQATSPDRAFPFPTNAFPTNEEPSSPREGRSPEEGESPYALGGAFPSECAPAVMEGEGLARELSMMDFAEYEVNLERVRSVLDRCCLEVANFDEVPAYDAPLHELGVDSMTAVEFADRAAEWLGVDLEPTLLFNYPTLGDVSEFLAQSLTVSGAQLRAPPSVGMTSALVEGGLEMLTGLAIVGAACNLPGNATSLDALWRSLRRGDDCVVEVPPSRWDADEFFSADPDAENKMYVREGGFIADAEYFDAPAFKVSPSEAAAMDPLQRGFLECVYQAVTDAGIRREQLAKADVGVYVGSCCNEWSFVDRLTQIGSYTAAATAPSMVSNRVSYTLGLVGPSLTVDTACSSSLVALHIAAHDLRSGGCAAAVVGGANLLLAPQVFVAFCKARMMAPDARCKTFDAAANGYIRGEGFAAVVLKLASCAVRDRDQTLAILRGTALNHGGRAASLTAPNGPAQQAVVRSALRAAQLEPCDLNYVEAHGTGTSLGDPIEVNALKTVFAHGRTADYPLILGAIKTNIGHLEGAAGLTGLLKAVLCVRHGLVPPNLHFQTLNPHIDTKNFPMTIPCDGQAVPLPSGLSYRKRLAGISSFGFGGTNAHVIVEEPERLMLGRASEVPDRQAPEEVLDVGYLFSGQGSESARAGAAAAYDDQYLFKSEMERVKYLFQRATEHDKSVRVSTSAQIVASAQTGTADTPRGSAYREVEESLFSVQYAIACAWAASGVEADGVIGEGVGEVVAAVMAGVMHLEDAVAFVVRKCALVEEIEGVCVLLTSAREDVELALAEVGPGTAQSIGLAAVYDERSVLVSGQRGDVDTLLLALGQVGGRARYLDCCHPLQSPLYRERFGEEFERFIRQSVKLHTPKRKMLARHGSFLSDEEAVSPSYWAGHLWDTFYIGEALKQIVSADTRVLVEFSPSLKHQDVLNQNVNLAAIDLHWTNVFHPPNADQATDSATEPAVSSVQRQIAFCGRIQKEMHERRANREMVQRSSKRLPYPWRQIPHPIAASKNLTSLRNGDAQFRAVLPLRTISLLADHTVNDLPILPGAGYLEICAAAAQSLGLVDPVSSGMTIENMYIESPLVIPTANPGAFEFGSTPVPRVGGSTPDEAQSSSAVSPSGSDSPSGDLDVGKVTRTPKRAFLDESSPRQDLPRSPLSSFPALEGATAAAVAVAAPDRSSPAVMICCTVMPDNRITLSSSRADERLELVHTVATISASPNVTAAEPLAVGIDEWWHEGPFEDVGVFYKRLRSVGLQYGPRFRTVVKVCRRARDAIGQLRVVPSPSQNMSEFEKGYIVHPTLLDGALQLSGLLLETASPSKKTTMVPVSVGKGVLFPSKGLGECFAHCRLIEFVDNKRATVTVRLYNRFQPGETPFATMENVVFEKMELRNHVQADIPRDLLWVRQWLDKELDTTDVSEGNKLSEGPGPSEGRLSEPSSVGAGDQPTTESLSSFFGTGFFLPAGATWLREALPATWTAIEVRDMRDSGKDVEAALASGKFTHLFSAVGLDPETNECDGVVHALQALQAYSRFRTSPGRKHVTLCFLTQGAVDDPTEPAVDDCDCEPVVPRHAGIWATVKTARLEIESATGETEEVCCVDLDPRGGKWTMQIEHVAAVLKRLENKNECEILVRARPAKNSATEGIEPTTSAAEQTAVLEETGTELSPWIVKFARLSVYGAGRRTIGPVEVVMRERGALSNLSVRAMPYAARTPPAETEVEVRVRAVGLNFRDVLNVMNLYPGDPGAPGTDFAGTVVCIGSAVTHFNVGDDVFGIAPGCLKHFATTSEQLVTKMPQTSPSGQDPSGQTMPFEYAAALPVILTTMYRALCEIAQLQSGQKVLVHAVTGGVGCMVAEYCRRVGAELYGSCSEKKREFALTHLGVERVGDSRCAKDFRETFADLTGQVDVVINCLTGAHIPASLDLLKEDGVFIELGKREIWPEERVREVKPHVRYEVLAIDEMVAEEPEAYGVLLGNAVEWLHSQEDGKTAGPLLPIKTFPVVSRGEEVVDAFRFLQRANHLGKVVVTFPSAVCEEARTGVTLVTGGLGSLGLVLGNWLVEEGVKRLVLCSRTGRARNPNEQDAVRFLQSLPSVTVETLGCDVADRDQVRLVLSSNAPVVAIFHCAGVLADGSLHQLTPSAVEEVYRAKVEGAWNLHRESENLEPGSVKQFVLFSSMASLLGNYGQSNYAAANACLDALACYRSRCGLPALSVQWGPWVEQGMASKFRNQLDKVGLKGITNELGLRVLADLLRQGPSGSPAKVLCGSDVPVSDGEVISRAPVVGCVAFRLSEWMQRYSAEVPRFYDNLQQAAIAEQTEEDGAGLLKRMSAVERREYVTQCVVQTAKQVLDTSVVPPWIRR